MLSKAVPSGKRTSMNLRHVLIVAAMGSGSLLVAFGLLQHWRNERRLAEVEKGTTSGARTSEAWPVRRWHLALLAVILCVAAILRLYGLEQRGMTHVEVYVPGIELPANISEPPPRTNIKDVVLWHWQGELHPPGYYFFMFGWTRAFGTGLFSIRLPSVLLGVACVALVFVFAVRLFDPVTGLVAATLLAINGHHIYWSQYARMYIMACALGLLSSILLYDLLRKPERAPLREAAYIVITWLALFTHVLSWALLAAQIVAVILFARASSGEYPRLLRTQAIVIMLGTPLVGHALMHSGVDYLDHATLRGLRNFLAFGFLFEPDGFSLPERSEPVWAVGAALVAALACLWFGLRAHAERHFTAEGVAARGDTTAIAFGAAFCTLGLALLSWIRQGWVATAAAVAIVTWLVVLALPRLWPHVQRLRDRRPRPLLADGTAFTLVLALFPVAALSLVSLHKPLLVSRGLVPFVPFLVVLLSAGLVAMARHRVLAAAMATVVLIVHVASINFYRAIPAPRDYRGLAAQMKQEFRPDDMVFVPPGRWLTSPLFYDLQGTAPRLVADSFEVRMREKPDARIWVPLFSGLQPVDEIAAALRGRRVEKTLTALRAEARLYVPDSATIQR